jgi:Sugar-specific transcriptional regulator TrmB
MSTTPRMATSGNRHLREIIRDEQFMRARVLKVLEAGPQTVPEIATALGRPTHEVVYWVMGLRKYGWVAEIKEVTDEGYFRYQAVPREQS